jgi:hypothetical protein
LSEALNRAGMELLGVYGDLDLNAPAETDERWYIVSRAKK